jgi:hypothetical protein
MRALPCVMAVFLACAEPRANRPPGPTDPSNSAPLLFARPAAGGTAHLTAPWSIGLGVGDRWGCAAFHSENRVTWQCWDARTEPEPWSRGLHAWPVPWLRDASVGVEADRLCTFSRDRKTRCWRPPVRGEAVGRELPVTPTPPTGDQPALAWGDVPSPDDAQCRAREGAVLCHGPGYSPPDSPGLPVAVRFDPGPPIAESAVVMVGRSTSWGPECLVERGCSRALVPIPRCGWLASARPWSEILPDASSLSGQVVHVRGVLGVALGFNTMMGCGPMPGTGTSLAPGEPETTYCCNTTSGDIAIGDAAGFLTLEGLSCGGDDSEMCCDAPAYGQSVIATGRLEPAWRLDDPSLCAL